MLDPYQKIGAIRLIELIDLCCDLRRHCNAKKQCFHQQNKNINKCKSITDSAPYIHSPKLTGLNVRYKCC